MIHLYLHFSVIQPTQGGGTECKDRQIAWLSYPQDVAKVLVSPTAIDVESCLTIYYRKGRGGNCVYIGTL